MTLAFAHVVAEFRPQDPDAYPRGSKQWIGRELLWVPTPATAEYGTDGELVETPEGGPDPDDPLMVPVVPDDGGPPFEAAPMSDLTPAATVG